MSALCSNFKLENKFNRFMSAFILLKKLFDFDNQVRIGINKKTHFQSLICLCYTYDLLHADV